MWREIFVVAIIGSTFGGTDFSRPKRFNRDDGWNWRTEDDYKDVTCGTYPVNPNLRYRIQTTFQQFQMFYPSGFDCTWKFHGSRCYPVISCNQFDVAESPDCSSARLEITDEFTVSKRYCGTTGPMNTTTGSTILTAIFPRSFTIPRKGFSCLVTCNPSIEGMDTIKNTLNPPPKANCTCGVPGSNSTEGQVPTHRVVGGKVAPPNYWKWQVAMMPKTRPNAFCGGSLINDRYVLSAAHCVIMTGLLALPQAGDVVLNAYNLKDKSEITIRRGIVAIYPHPFYNAITQDYDYSIVEFSEPVNLVALTEPNVRTVCLPPKDMRESFEGKTATVTGWGVTEEGGKQSMLLKEADIPVISNTDCSDQYKKNKSSTIKITDRMLCAGYEMGGTDACQGDSGGPFVLKQEDGRFMQIGVVSFGEGCARKGKPGVYARVTEVNDWIRATAKRATWCSD